MSEKKFNVTRNDKGQVIGIEFNADVFIVPNRAGTLNDFWFEHAAKKAKDFVTMVTGKEPEENERLIQVWYVVKDLDCSNLVDHGTHVEIDGIRYRIDLNSPFLPYSILRDKNEGDVIDITFLNGKDEWDEYDQDIMITMHVKLDQTHYRYARFGTFQEVLKHVTQ